MLIISCSFNIYQKKKNNHKKQQEKVSGVKNGRISTAILMKYSRYYQMEKKSLYYKGRSVWKIINLQKLNIIQVIRQNTSNM